MAELQVLHPGGQAQHHQAASCLHAELAQGAAGSVHGQQGVVGAGADQDGEVQGEGGSGRQRARRHGAEAQALEGRAAPSA